MNLFFSKKKEIKGTVVVPSSKSIAQRAIAIATLTNGRTILKNVSFSDDVLSAVNIAKTLGTKVFRKDDKLIINADFKILNNILYTGESGLATRMFLPVASLSGENFTIKGKGTLLNRDFKNLEEKLLPFGINVKTNDGKLPLQVSGKLHASSAVLDASDTSQLLTGLLISLPLTDKDSVLNVSNLTSRPYVDLTIDMMQKFGVSVKNNDYKEFFIPSTKYKPTEIKLEGDWSSAAYWFVAAAIAGEVKILGLTFHTKQADKSIIEVLWNAEVDMILNQNYFYITKSEVQAFEFDASDCPDLFPALAVLAAAAEGISRIKGLSRLKNKETDRSKAIVTEFSKCGVKIFTDGDYLIIDGGLENLKFCKFKTYNDHRMAMAAAILALVNPHGIEIDNPACVSKSYPLFFEHYASLLK